jgi:UDP-GlcNAc3NAcA epimerase
VGLVPVRESSKAGRVGVKVISVIGTRPQLVKAAVVTRALRDDGRFEEVTVDTGQHYDPEMSTLLLDDLPGVRTSRNLGLHGGTSTELLARMVDAIGEVLIAEQPDAVLVYGDTNSTLAGALAASSLKLPLAHVEAGLRSFNRLMSEERTRVLVDHAADLLLCPTTGAVQNLASEGITRGVHHVGDVMYDAVLAARDAVTAQPSDLLDQLGLARAEYAVATIHRAETTDDREALGSALAYLRAVGGGPVAFPIHPRTRKAIDAAGLTTDGLLTCAPLGYLDMTRLLMQARAVYTDSGGIQKEAYFHRVPCVTLRTETEWGETIDAGWNRLWSSASYQPRHEITDYGNGNAGREIARILAEAWDGR